jgi:hypothetical protein
MNAPDLSSVAEAVRQATRELIQAASDGDAALIEQSIDKRALAVSDLESVLRSFPAGSPVADDLRADLALQAAEAEESLRRLIEENGGRLRTLASRSAGIGGYTAHSRGSSALDRSG